MRYHPDRNSEPTANEKFLRVQQAYEILMNPLSRNRYDTSLSFNAGFSSRPLSRAEQKDPGYRRSRTTHHSRPGHTQKPREKNPDPEEFRLLENVLFYSLLAIGFIAIFFSARDLWLLPWDDLNNFTGIIFGLSFTALLIYSWTQVYRKKK
jgi:curved DNA-binding protein CbpA